MKPYKLTQTQMAALRGLQDTGELRANRYATAASLVNGEYVTPTSDGKGYQLTNKGRAALATSGPAGGGR